MKFKLRRTPVSFAWPLYEPWPGFMNEHETAFHDCPKCDGTGFSTTARRLHQMWYGKAPFRPEDRSSIPLKPSDPHVKAFASKNLNQAPDYYGVGEAALEREATRLCYLWNKSWSHHLNDNDVLALLAADRLWDLTRNAATGEACAVQTANHRPTASQVNIWSIQSAGHDTTNMWICSKAECERLGVSYSCEHCVDGTVWDSAEAKAAYEAWLPTEPPVGDGYQMWASEGAGYPVSPVFASTDEMASWMSVNELKCNESVE